MRCQKASSAASLNSVESLLLGDVQTTTFTMYMNRCNANPNKGKLTGDRFANCVAVVLSYLITGSTLPFVCIKILLIFSDD